MTFLQGVGVSLMLVQGLTGVYSIVVTSWMFVYFRDSFITIHQVIIIISSSIILTLIPSLHQPYKWSRCEKDVPAFEELRHCHLQNANQNWSLQGVGLTLASILVKIILLHLLYYLTGK